MKFILLIFFSIVATSPLSFNLDRSSQRTNIYRSSGSLPDNGIINIEAISPTQIYFGTSSGLGRVDIEGGDKIFSSVKSGAMPEGGNPALAIGGNVITVSGVTTYYSAATESNEAMGTGVSYSVDSGNTWKFMEQPIVENPENNLYYPIEWGGDTLQIIAVTTAVNNVSYDLAIHDDYIYSTSWAGGLQRFRYTDDSPKWEVIPLPMDDEFKLICGEIDNDGYELNPKDPKDGGNHNHKGFSVFIEGDIIWVGTANGINKGKIDGDCIDWEKHITYLLSGISGNWVIGFESGLGKLWAITWAIDASLENTGLSYSEDNGETWYSINYFSDQNLKVYSIKIADERIYASTIQGLYVSEDGEHWELIPDFVDSITGEMILDDAVYTTYIPTGEDEVWVGTGDGLAIRESNGLVDIIRFWEVTEKPYEGDFNFSVYPNPFYVKDDNFSNDSGHVRFIYNVGSNGTINIYNFSMDHVIDLTHHHSAGSNDEREIIWNGRNSSGSVVTNGVYFCKLTANNQDYWTKLVVVN